MLFNRLKLFFWDPALSNGLASCCTVVQLCNFGAPQFLFPSIVYGHVCFLSFCYFCLPFIVYLAAVRFYPFSHFVFQYYHKLWYFFVLRHHFMLFFPVDLVHSFVYQLSINIEIIWKRKFNGCLSYYEIKKKCQKVSKCSIPNMSQCNFSYLWSWIFQLWTKRNASDVEISLYRDEQFHIWQLKLNHKTVQ